MILFKETGTVIHPSSFTLRIRGALDKNRQPINLLNTPFHFEFFDEKVFDKIRNCKKYDTSDFYVVSFDGTTRVNNYVENGEVIIMFDSYDFEQGKLCYRQTEKYANPAFESGEEIVITVLKTDVEIKTVGVNDTNKVEYYALIAMSAFKGENGKSPYIDDTTKTWWVYDDTLEEYIDTAYAAQGPKGDQGDVGPIGPIGPKGDPGEFTGFATLRVDVDTMQLIVDLPDDTSEYNFTLEDGYLKFNIN